MPRAVQPARPAWRPRRAAPSAYRISEQTDTNDAYNTGTADGAVDSSDPVFFIFTDLQGRRLATYRNTDTYPKETFIHHAAGLGGPHWKGGPLLRDRDGDCSKPENWSSQAANSTRTERRYYASDFRGNVTALVTDTGELAEQYRYSATGVPFGIPLGDVTSDGTVSATDSTEIAKISTPNYHVRGDLNLDGTVDSNDAAIVSTNSGTVTGRGTLSAAGVGTKIANAGSWWEYEWTFRMNETTHSLLDVTLNSEVCESISARLAPPVASSIAPDSCIQSLLRRCEHNQAVAMAVAHVNRNCRSSQMCDKWNVVCNPVLRPEGRTLCSTCVIEVRITGSNVTDCDTLAHELVHAGDLCAWGQCVRPPHLGIDPDGFGDPRTGQVHCRAWMCSEVRAWWWGCCSRSSRPWRELDQVEKCYQDGTEQFRRGPRDFPYSPCHPDDFRTIEAVCKPSSCSHNIPGFPSVR